MWFCIHVPKHIQNVKQFACIRMSSHVPSIPKQSLNKCICNVHMYVVRYVAIIQLKGNITSAHECPARLS